jgi:hypothetical protein
MCVSGSGKLIDNNAVDLIEVDDLGELGDPISGISVGSAERRKKDILGRWVYEGASEFHTSLFDVEVIEPLAGRVYVGCCGMLAQVEGFVEAHAVYRSKTPVQVCDLRFGDQIRPLGGIR